MLYTEKWKNYKDFVTHIDKMPENLVREFSETRLKYDKSCKSFESISEFQLDVADMLGIDALFVQFAEAYSQFIETHAKCAVDLEKIETRLSERTVRTDLLNASLERLDCLFLLYLKFDKTFESLSSSFRRSVNCL